MTFKGNCSAHGGNGKPLKKVLALRVMTFKGNCSAHGGNGKSLKKSCLFGL